MIKTFFIHKIKYNMSEVIIFNSKSKNYYLLSNFYGGVEISYMKGRFQNIELQQLFDEINVCNIDKFIYYLKILQPEKAWSDKQLNYWIRTKDDDTKEPIRGILAKLIGTSVKDTPTGRKRLKIIKKLLHIEGEIIINKELNLDEKKEFMLKCLRDKYSSEPYKSLLLSTGDKKLHEKPMRGSGDLWTYPGGNLLGKLLEIVREELN